MALGLSLTLLAGLVATPGECRFVVAGEEQPSPYFELVERLPRRRSREGGARSPGARSHRRQRADRIGIVRAPAGDRQLRPRRRLPSSGEPPRDRGRNGKGEAVRSGTERTYVSERGGASPTSSQRQRSGIGSGETGFSSPDFSSRIASSSPRRLAATPGPRSTCKRRPDVIPTTPRFSSPPARSSNGRARCARGRHRT